jgi:murein DD-endopeptidase MepM/ murein hydrolase activator NlpD
LIAAERYREAIHFCQQELAASPRCVTLRLWLARAFLADGAGAKGVAELEECLRIDPMSAAARELLQDLGVAVPSLPLPALKPVAPKPHAARPVAAPAKPAARPVAAQAQAKPAAPRAAAPRAAAPRAAAPRAAAPRAAASAVAAAQPIHATRERAVLVYEPPPRKTQPPPPLRATYEPPPTTPPHVVFPPSPRVIYSSPSLPPPEPPSVVSARVGHDSPAKAAKARRSASRRRLAFESPFAEESQPPSQPSPSASGWQRPLGIEPRGPERWPRIAVVALGLLGIVLAWRLYREDRAALPVAVVAASRPTPEPPVVKADVPTLNAVGGDAWIHPLAGPQRRMPERDSRLFGAERTGDRPSECRGGHCGVDLAGAYGEPVYAVHDGVVEFVQRAVNPDHGGRFVRLTHRNGTIATQYFHLSQIPSRIAAGVTVRAGDVIGYVGLTGVKHSEPHLHFTIEVQDPSGMDGRYLDPEPLVALWPLRISPKGSELRVSATSAPGLARGFLRRRHRPHHSDDE